MTISNILKVLVTGSATGLATALTAAGRHVEQFRAKVSSVATAAAKSAAVMGGAVVTAAAGLAVYAVKLAADAEQARVSFTTMLGSAEKARELTAEINKFAASTPFETTELIQASKALLAFGVSQGQVIPTMRTLGDLSAGLNIPLTELADLYGKARVQGRLMAQDVNQLTGRGIPVIQQFAKQFGVTEGEVRKLVEQGKIGFPQLQKALIDLTAEGGQFGGMMAAQSQTLTGLWSTLSDSVALSLTKVGETLTENLDLKNAIRGISDAVSIIGESLIPVISSLAGSFGGTGDAAQTASNVIIGAARIIGYAIAYATNVVDSFRLMFKGVQWAGLMAFRNIARAATLVAEGIAWLVNKGIEQINRLIQHYNTIPFVDIQPEIELRLAVDSSGVEGIDQTISALAGEMGEIADNMTGRVDGVGQFFDEISRKADEARKAQQAMGDASKATAMAIEEGAFANAAAINELLNKMRTQVETFGQTAEQKQIDELTKLGATAEQIAQAQAFQNQLKALEAQKKAHDEMKQSAKSLYDSTRTDAEKYAAQIEKINELLMKGHIDQQTAQRAADQAREELRKSQEKGKTDPADGPRALQVGSADAAKFVSDIQRRQQGADKQDQLVKQGQQGNRFLSQIVKNTESAGGGFAVNLVSI